MSIKVIEIALLIITLFLLWLCCYPDYVGVWGRGILRLFKGNRKEGEPEVICKQTNDNEENK